MIEQNERILPLTLRNEDNAGLLLGTCHSIMANQRVFAVGKDSISALGIVEEPEENLGLSLLSNLQGFRLVEEAQRLLNKKMLLMYSLATCMLEVS